MLHRQPYGLSKTLLIAILGVVALIIFGVVLVIFTSGGGPNPDRITLTMWGVWDETDDWKTIISAYERAHPYVTIKYSKKRFEEYEDMLISGWADAPSTGPDIYALPNTWINNYRDRYITPMPKNTEVAFFRTEKILFKEDIKIKYITEPTLAPADIKRDYIDVVYNDMIFDNKIYGLPLGINTLVMYYNRDLLNQAGLAVPPQRWNNFTSAISSMSIVDNETNAIVRSGAALGTAENVTHANDIVSLLMMQNGATMTTGNSVTFHLPSANDPSYYPGEQALRFYTDFSAPEKSVFTWDDNQPQDMEAFADGEVVFYFGYPYEEADIKRLAGGLEFSMAPMPQVNPTQNTNFANYWAYTVAKKTAAIDEAWDFLQYAAEAKRVTSYLENTGQTSVLRSILNEQLADPDIGPLAEQALTAQSWYRGKSPVQAAADFNDMIAQAASTSGDTKTAITATAKKIQQTYVPNN